MAQRVWTDRTTSVLLALILLLAGGLRFWNVTHDSDLAATVSTDARGKFNDVKQLVTTGELRADPDKRYQLYNQPLLLIRSYATIWRAAARVGLASGDQRMRVGFTAYMILFALGTVALVFLLGRTVLADERQALFASLLFAVLPVNVVGSLYVKEDIPLMFFFTAALLALAALVRSGRRGWYLWGGVLIGLAVGTKYTGLLLLPIFGLAHLLVVFNAARAERLRALLAWQAFAALALAALAFALFNMQVITEWPDFLKGFLFQVRYASSGHRDGTVIRGIDYWWTFYLRYAIIPGITLPATLFFLAGIVVAFVRRNRPLLLIAAAVLLVYFQLESSPAKPFPFFARYLDMLYPLMALLATFAFFALWRRLARSPRTRAAGVAVGLALILLPLGQSALLAAGARTDTRVRAAQWMNANLPPGTHIALGSRPYSPQHLDKTLFQVNYDDNIHTRSVQQLRKAKFTYLVINSFQYDRYPFSVASSPTSQKAVQGYAAFERELELIKVFQPRFAFQSYGEHNPVIKIYRFPTQ